jgi:hypothetical protein
MKERSLQKPMSISMSSSWDTFCPASYFHTNWGRSKFRWAPVRTQTPIRMPKYSKSERS